MTSDQIAAIALIVALGSLWISYKSWYQSRKLVAAEKQTQLLISLVNTRLSIQDLPFTIREISQSWTTSKNTFEIGSQEKPSIHEHVDAFIETYKIETLRITNIIQLTIEELKTRSLEDPVELEKHKSMALEIDSRVKKLMSDTSSLKASIVSLTSSPTK
jgi:hypothetical protein